MKRILILSIFLGAALLALGIGTYVPQMLKAVQKVLTNKLIVDDNQPAPDFALQDVNESRPISARGIEIAF